METFRVQAQIRANAEEVQDSLRELRQWEQQMSKKDADLKRRQAKAGAGQGHQRPVIRASGGTVGVRTGSSIINKPTVVKTKAKAITTSGATAADHTYDKGYKRWEKFDIDAALADEGSDGEKEENDENVASQGGVESGQPVQESATPLVTPATITADAARIEIDKSKVVRPRPRNQSVINPEDAEREKGNEHYRKGEFVLAIKCYTRAIGYNSSSAIAFSNRAMAYLKTKEFKRADADATVALSIDPRHVKSLQRRAAARTNLGMHRAALQDLQKAVDLEPSRELMAELRRAQEMVRACIRRAPKTPIPIKIMASVELPPTPPPPSATPLPTSPLDVVGDSAPPIVAMGTSSSTYEGEGAVFPPPVREQPPMKPKEDDVMPVAKGPQKVVEPGVPPVPSKVPVSVPKAPKNSYEMQRHWRSLGSDPQVRTKYLQGIKPSTLPKVFSHNIEPEFLADLVSSLVDLPGGGPLISEWILALQQVPRLDMTMMLLSQKDKGRILRALEEIESRWGGKDVGPAVSSLRNRLGT